MSYLVAVACVLNEAPYLKQWIDFHLLQGFEKFYFYDNNSTDNTYEVLKPYIEKDIAELRKYPNNLPLAKGMWAVESSINEFSGKHNWLFQHSIDEYMYSKDGKKVSEVLKEYENYSGYIIPWKLFNSDNNLYKEDNLVIERFHTWTDDISRHIKTIIQPHKTLKSVGNPHAYYFKEGFAVDGEFIPQERIMNGGATNGTRYYMDKLVLNHYVTMSKQEFEIKMNKGRCDITHLENVRRSGAEAQWADLHNPSRKFYICHDLDKYIPLLKNM